MAKEVNTDKQENGSKVFFEKYIESTRTPSESELFSVVVKVYPELAKNSDMRKLWMSTYEKQAVALKKYLGNSKGYAYSRDEKNGFMYYIESIAKSRCGVTTKDNWDPADIYLVKKQKENTIKRHIDSITKSPDENANILSLNSYMRELIQTKDLVPVSLKAIKTNKKIADAELSNMGKGKQKELTYESIGPLKCFVNFGTNSKTEFEIDNGEIAGQFKIGDSIVNWQTRNFNMSSQRGGIQTDITPTGKDAGAKLGKSSIDSIDDFFAKYGSKLGLTKPPSASKDPYIPAPGQWTEKDKKYWVDYVAALQKHSFNGRKIDFGGMKIVFKGKTIPVKSGHEFKNILDYCVMYEETTPDGKFNKYAAGRLSSKLQCFRWAYVWTVIEKKGLLEEWIKALYYGAKKEFRDTNGPFLKIY